MTLAFDKCAKQWQHNAWTSGESWKTSIDFNIAPTPSYFVMCHSGSSMKVLPDELDVHLAHGDSLGLCDGDGHANVAPGSSEP